MKFFTIPGACSAADHIALHWTGQPFEVEVLTPEKLRSADYLRLNPAGSVPALTDRDFQLTQNAEATRWLMLCNADMQPVFGTFFAPMSYIADPAQHASLHASSHLKLRRLFERVHAQLEQRDWLAGFRSVADAYLFIMLRWAAAFHVDLEGLSNLVAFRRRMQQDAGVQAALATEGLA